MEAQGPGLQRRSLIVGTFADSFIAFQVHCLRKWSEFRPPGLLHRHAIQNVHLPAVSCTDSRHVSPASACKAAMFVSIGSPRHA